MSNNQIKNWPKDERPREKLFRKGEQSLSNTELLAILLRTGVRGESAIELARKIIQKFENFQNMSQIDVRDWNGFKGLGPAKIAQIKAALEIARRFTSKDGHDGKISIRTTEEAVLMFQSRMRHLKKENFKAVFLDPKNRVLGEADIAEGTPNECYPILREIISRALQSFATALICLHNHPRGSAMPSVEDERFTQELKEAGKLMGLIVSDHIIFGEEDYYSFDRRTTVPYGAICLTKT
jgi:DNA repair protein RadC